MTCYVWLACRCTWDLSYDAWYYIIARNIREANEIFFEVTCRTEIIELIRGTSSKDYPLSSLKRGNLIRHAWSIGWKLKRLPGITYKGTIVGTKVDLSDRKFSFKLHG